MEFENLARVLSGSKGCTVNFILEDKEAPYATSRGIFVPSSWREANIRKEKADEVLQILFHEFQHVRNSKKFMNDYTDSYWYNKVSDGERVDFPSEMFINAQNVLLDIRDDYLGFRKHKGMPSVYDRGFGYIYDRLLDPENLPWDFMDASKKINLVFSISILEHKRDLYGDRGLYAQVQEINNRYPQALEIVRDEQIWKMIQDFADMKVKEVNACFREGTNPLHVVSFDYSARVWELVKATMTPNPTPEPDPEGEEEGDGTDEGNTTNNDFPQEQESEKGEESEENNEGENEGENKGENEDENEEGENETAGQGEEEDEDDNETSDEGESTDGDGDGTEEEDDDKPENADGKSKADSEFEVQDEQDIRDTHDGQGSGGGHGAATVNNPDQDMFYDPEDSLERDNFEALKNIAEEGFHIGDPIGLRRAVKAIFETNRTYEEHVNLNPENLWSVKTDPEMIFESERVETKSEKWLVAIIGDNSGSMTWDNDEDFDKDGNPITAGSIQTEIMRDFMDALDDVQADDQVQHELYIGKFGGWGINLREYENYKVQLREKRLEAIKEAKNQQETDELLQELKEGYHQRYITEVESYKVKGIEQKDRVDWDKSFNFCDGTAPVGGITALAKHLKENKHRVEADRHLVILITDGDINRHDYEDLNRAVEYDLPKDTIFEFIQVGRGGKRWKGARTVRKPSDLPSVMEKIAADAKFGK